MCFSTGGSANKMAKQQRADEVAREGRVRSGMGSIDQIFSAFNDDFYDRRAGAYRDYAMPEVEHQAQDARRKLIFALSRAGNLDSSSAISRDQELQRTEDRAKIDVANEGMNVANRTRADVEQTRSGVVSQLNATGDSSAASSAALREMQRLQMPQGFSPLGQLFGNFLQGVSAIGSNPGNGYRGLFGAREPAFSFGGAGSARVVKGGG